MNSKTVWLVGGVVLLLVGAIGGYLIGVSSGSTRLTTVTTISSTSEAYAQVNNSYANHLLSFGSKNVSVLLLQYESDAKVRYEGASTGLTGNYTGSESIKQLLIAFEAATSTNYFYVTNETHRSLQVTSAGSGNSTEVVVVNSTFDFRGQSRAFGDFSGTVSARTTFVHGGAGSSSWLISEEIWRFLKYTQQYPVTT